ncbi:MAG: hypothetical protein ACI4QM_01505 [Alphaproteobacteria bacterium]
MSGQKEKNEFLWQKHRPFDKDLERLIYRLKENINRPPLLSGIQKPTQAEALKRQRALCKMVDETARTNIGRHVLGMMPSSLRLVSYEWADKTINSDGLVKAYTFMPQTVINVYPSTLSDPMAMQVNTLVHEGYHVVHSLLEGINLRRMRQVGLSTYLNAYDLFFLLFLNEAAAHINGQVGAIQYKKTQNNPITLNMLFGNEDYWQVSYGRMLSHLDTITNPVCELNSVHTPAFYFIQHGYFSLHPEIRHPKVIRYIHRAFKLFADDLKVRSAECVTQKVARHDWTQKYTFLIQQAAERACLIRL